MPGFSNNMFSLLGMQDGGFAKGKGMTSEYDIPAAQPSMSPAAATEAGKLGAGIGGVAPSTATGGIGGYAPPSTATGGVGGGSAEMTGGTALTPATPSAAGGGTGGLPSATFGKTTTEGAAETGAYAKEAAV